MIRIKHTFVCSNKCNTCVFNNKNFTDICEVETERDIFIQEGEINIVD